MRKVLFILGELSDLDVDWLIANGRKEVVPAGTTLIHEGKPIDALYIILDGSLSVLLVKRGDREIARIGAGEIVGEISFVDNRPPLATVRAVEKSVLLALPRKKLEAKLKQDPGFGGRFYRAVAVFLADRLRRTTSQLGFSDGRPAASSAKEDEAGDDLEGNILDNVHLAGARFDRMLKRLMGS